jgi:hypothetical protein
VVNRLDTFTAVHEGCGRERGRSGLVVRHHDG